MKINNCWGGLTDVSVKINPLISSWLFSELVIGRVPSRCHIMPFANWPCSNAHLDTLSTHTLTLQRAWPFLVALEASASVFLFFCGYFDPDIVCLDNENK